MSTPTPERVPTRAEFRQEVLAALRAAGLEGPFEHDDKNYRLLHAGQGALDLSELYDNLSRAPAAKRAEVLASMTLSLAEPGKVPLTWEEAKRVVMLDVTTKIAVAADEVRQARGAKSSPVTRSEISAHLLLQVVVPMTAGKQAVVANDLLAHWGVGPDAAFHAASENLRRASDKGWGMLAEAPGVYFSTWNDGFDAARLAFPRVFAQAPIRGRAVALAPSTRALAFAGSDDEEGLFHLARLTKRLYDKNHSFLFLRSIRMGADGESWEDWMPEKGHGAYEGFRLLQAINEVYDAEEHARLIHRAAEGKGTPMPMPPLEIVVQEIGAEPMTITRWKAGPAPALPKADAIVFEDESQVLGIARWDDVVAKLPDSLKAMPGYPIRYMAGDFPEGWQLGSIELAPWKGPRPP